MIGTTEQLGQEWCSAEGLELKDTGYITQFEPNKQKFMVLCNKESHLSRSVRGTQTIIENKIIYRPLKFEDLNKVTV